MNILVTGGAGFIGSHTVVELIEAGHNPVIVDNLCNSSFEVLERIKKITDKEVPFFRTDIRDETGMERVFADFDFDCCIHFAGLKAVGESVENPLKYYDYNIIGTITLLKVLKRHMCKNFIFSSSATVYGEPETMPITEDFPTGACTNPYGMTKHMIEKILTDMYTADIKTGAARPWNIVLLRYFNPVGAHSSGLIGENPRGIPNNLMPYINQVAAGKLPKLTVFGNDYDTPDGTGIRDYIHVVDLARGHVKALSAIEKSCELATYNLGTGNGYSVLDMINTFISVNGVDVPYEIGPRREGDIAICYSDPSKAEKELGFKAEFGLEEMCRDTWKWQQNSFEK